jgi:hypothetical protein
MRINWEKLPFRMVMTLIIAAVIVAILYWSICTCFSSRSLFDNPCLPTKNPRAARTATGAFIHQREGEDMKTIHEIDARSVTA